MKVVDIMMGTPYFCRPESNLGSAAECMWRGNCGFLPVVGNEGKVVGVITDRDICIALGTRGCPSGEAVVADVMSRKVWSCAPEDEVAAALHKMREGRVRRLPVISKEDALVGVLSLDDILLRADAANSVNAGSISPEDILRAFRAINTHQLSLVVTKHAAA
jgi:CBS domain-containing protein